MAQKVATARFETDEARWAAVVARDPAAEGAFLYSVRSTRIYCRPTCAARRPNRANVGFHADARAAERAGFRPCKRCRPRDAAPVARPVTLVVRACRQIEAAEEAPSLDALATELGVSRYHFQRMFKAITGVTPGAYAAARRAAKMRDELARAATVTEAVYAAGFGSSSRFHAAAQKHLGMTPSAYRAGGAGADIRFAVGECSLGAVLVAASARGICAISLGDDAEKLVREVQDRFPAARFNGGDAKFESWVAAVIGFIDQPGRALGLPLDIRGTAFQRQVWQALTEIPFGATLDYTTLARRLGRPEAVRAVASACAANTLAVAIPCHRVVRKDGGLAGYRWGVERKRALLAREGGKPA